MHISNGILDAEMTAGKRILFLCAVFLHFSCLWSAKEKAFSVVLCFFVSSF
jgi:hypothetical protein